MFTFFSQCGYPCTSLEHDLQRVASVSRSDALRSSGWSDTALDRVPLVLKNQSKQFLLQNFRVCMPQPPFVAYKCNFIPRDILVPSTVNSSTEQSGPRACQRPRWQTYNHISPLTDIGGPKCSFAIRDHFACQSKNLVYCISCCRCPLLYIG